MSLRLAGESVAGARHKADIFSSRVRDSLLLAGVNFAFMAIVFRVLAHYGAARYPVAATWLAFPWLPLGAAAGTFLFRGANRWPGAFGGVFLAGVWLHVFPFAQNLLQATADTLSAALVAALLRVWGFDPSISHWRHPLVLWASAGLGAMCQAFVTTAILIFGGTYWPGALDPALARIVLGATGHPTLSMSLLWAIVRWFGNWATGVALVVPCVYVLVGDRRERIASRPAETLVLALLVGIWVLAAFAPLPAFAFLALAAAALLLVVWSAIRLGTTAVSLLTLCLTLATSFSVMVGHGPPQLQPADAVATVWVFVITLSAVGLLATVLVSERDVASRRYATLFDSNPIPAWVQERRSGRILMVNDAALQHYGHTRTEFARLVAADLEAQERPDATTGAVVAPLNDGREHLHRTRGGALISVELCSQSIELDGREASLVFSYDVTERNRLRSAYLNATDRAARQLGQELHDGLGQELVGLSLITRSVITRAGRGASLDAESIDLIDRIAQRAVLACRNIAHGLSALVETGGNLAAVLRALPARFDGEGMPQFSVEIEDEAGLALSDAARDHVYRICQEALTNAVKHARAQHIDIRLAATDSRVVLTVRDDGMGLPPAAARGSGLGLSSMQIRAAAIGARLYVASPSGGGTEVRLECPHGLPTSETGRGSIGGDASAETGSPASRQSRPAG